MSHCVVGVSWRDSTTWPIDDDAVNNGIQESSFDEANISTPSAKLHVYQMSWRESTTWPIDADAVNNDI